MISIKVERNESIDKALKRFKRKLEKAGIIKEYRNRKFFEKKSIIRRREISKAIYKQKMNQDKD